jgi:hypothetical protein
LLSSSSILSWSCSSLCASSLIHSLWQWTIMTWITTLKKYSKPEIM